MKRVKSLLFKTFFKKNRKDSDAKELVKGGSISLFIQIIGLGFGYALVLLITRVYGDESAHIYGEYTMITLLVKLGSLVGNFGINTSMLRFTAGFSKQNLIYNIATLHKKAVKIIGISTGIVFLALVTFHSVWEKVFKVSSLYIFASAVFIGFQALGLYFAQGLRGFKEIATSSFLLKSSLPTFNTVLFILLILLIPSYSQHYNFIPSISLYISVALSLLLGYVWWRKAINKRKLGSEPFLESKDISTRALLLTSYPLMLAESMLFLNTWVNQLMLGGMVSSEALGVFSVCVKYNLISSLFLQSVNNISAPKFAEFHAKEDFKSLKKVIKQSTKMMFLATLPIVLVFTLFPNVAMGIFGEQFKQGSTALVILSIAKLFSVMSGSVGNILQMTGHQKKVQQAILASIAISVVLNLWLIPFYGITGAAISSAAGTIVVNLIMLLYVKKYFGFYSIYFFGMSK